MRCVPRLLLLLVASPLFAQTSSSPEAVALTPGRRSAFALPRELAAPGSHFSSRRARLRQFDAAPSVAAITLPFPSTSYDSGGGVPSAIQIGDLNGDHIPDVVVLNECTTGSPASCSGEGVVSVLLGNGDGTFRSAASYSSGGYTAQSLALADINRDGHLDVVVLNTCGNDPTACTTGSIGILYGNGDGTLQSAQTFDLGRYYPSSIAVGDLNRDGRPDLVVSYFCADASCVHGLVQVFLGKGNGTFRTPRVFDSGSFLPVQVVLGDLNGDGKLDLVLPHCGGPDCFFGKVTTLLGRGDGTFRPAQVFSSGGVNPLAVAIGDLSRDGRPDIVVANDCLSPGSCSNNIVLGVLVGKGNGTFQDPQMSASGLFSEGCSNSGYCSVSVQIADLDGDGNLDVISGSDLYLGNGDGTLQSPQSYNSVGSLRGQLAIADLNADGAPDIALAAFDDNQVDILINPNQRTLTTTALAAQPSPSAFGVPVIFAAMVASTGAPAPTGTVTFVDGNRVLASATLHAGVASFTTSTLTPGRHLVTARYNGDTTNRTSSSPVFVQVVTKGATSCAIQTHTVYFNHQIHNVFTASVTAVPPAPAQPAGTVSFLDSAYSEITLGSAQLRNGRASITAILDPEPDPQWVKAVYPGNRDFTGCESPYLTIFTQ